MGERGFVRKMESSDKLFSEGDRVFVKRSDGTIEDDWIVESFENDHAMVVKTATGQKLQKKVPIETLNQWQEQNNHNAREIKSNGPEQREMAKKLGVNTDNPNWQKELESKIRKLSGT